MGDVSDIEELLAAAKKQKSTGWWRTLLVGASTLVGSFFGAGYTAGAYMQHLTNQIDSLTALQKGVALDVKDLGAAREKLAARIDACELRAGFQDKTSETLRADIKELQARTGTKRGF